MSEKQQPLVSFGIPTYNRADKIHVSIDSILRQGYDNIEIIISDNDSADNTKEICEAYAEKDSRIKYFRQKTNLGLIGNWEFVHKQATGKYYMHLADDDWMEDNVLLKYVDFMEENPAYACCSGQFARWRDGEIWFVEKDYNVEQDNPAERVVANNKMMVHCGMYYGLMRRPFIDRVKPRMMIQHDWLIISGIAYLGKIKNFDFIGYNKVSGGISSEWSERYARNVGATRFAAYFSYYVTGFKTFTEILYVNKLYRKSSLLTRFSMGIKSWWNITKRFYIDPVKVSGKAGFEAHIVSPLKGFLRIYSLYKVVQWANNIRKKIF